MKTILRYLRPYIPRMSLGLAIKIGGTMAELLIPYILSHILKEVIVTQDIRQVIFWGVMMMVCSGIACLMNIIANRMAARVSRNFSEHLRRDLFHKMLHLSAAQTDRFTIPSLESRITSDTYHLHHFINMMQRMGVRAPIMLVGGIAITLLMDPFLSLSMLAILPFIFVTVYFFSKKGIPMFRKVQTAVDRMTRVVREDVMGIRVIKALSKTAYESRRYDQVNADLAKDEQKAGLTTGAINPIMTFLMNGGIALVISMAAFRVAGHRSDPETVVAFMQYFTQISMAMMTISRIFVMYTRSAASAGRIGEVLNIPSDMPLMSEADCPSKETDAHIEFEQVSFSYLGKKNDLENIDFALPRGGSLGIIGATGSGKSTFIKLLTRFYDATEGKIFINGRDIRTIPDEELRPMFGVAQQQDFVYAETVEDNIRFGRDLSAEQIRTAAKIAQANDFITAFPEGYAHPLSAKGTNVSGGQRQRILIARAVAASPEILVLDDSSSALDYRTDANLRKALKEQAAGTTLITVAQRVSTIKDCDLILVLEQGRIIGRGTHEELLASCPEYKEISDSQMGGAFVE